MDPDIFQYKDLHYDEPHFRLLRLGKQSNGPIECELVDAFFNDDDHVDDMISYVAISYRWDADQTTKNSFIMIGDARFYVTRGVYELLEHLQTAENSNLWFDEGGLIWIDAVCINQDNETEKGHQIGYMKDVFSRANNVVVWLGSATPESSNVMLNLKILEKLIPRNRLWRLEDDVVREGTLRDIGLRNGRPVEDFLPELRNSLERLVEHSWFQRVWVLQEVANAKRAFVLCGRQTISTHYFTIGPRIVNAHISHHCQAALNLMPGLYRKRENSQDLFALLKTYAGSKASEDKDCIFALFGLYSGPTDFHYLTSFYDKPNREIIRAVMAYKYRTEVELVPLALCEYDNIMSFISELDAINAKIVDYLPLHPDVCFGRVFLRSVEQPINWRFDHIVDLLKGNRRTGDFFDMLLLDHDAHTPDVGNDDLAPNIFGTYATTEVSLSKFAGERISGARFSRVLCERCPDETGVSRGFAQGVARNAANGLEILREVYVPRESVDITILAEKTANRELFEAVFPDKYKGKKGPRTTANKMRRDRPCQSVDSESHTARSIMHCSEVKNKHFELPIKHASRGSRSAFGATLLRALRFGR